MVAWAVEGLLCLACAASGLMKLLDPDPDPGRRVRYPRVLMRAVAVVELIGAAALAVGEWVHPLALLAGVGVSLLMVGAIHAHVARAHDPAARMVPASALLLLSLVVIWARR